MKKIFILFMAITLLVAGCGATQTSENVVQSNDDLVSGIQAKILERDSDKMIKVTNVVGNEVTGLLGVRESIEEEETASRGRASMSFSKDSESLIIPVGVEIFSGRGQNITLSSLSEIKKDVVLRIWLNPEDETSIELIQLVIMGGQGNGGLRPGDGSGGGPGDGSGMGGGLGGPQ